MSNENNSDGEYMTVSSDGNQEPHWALSCPEHTLVLVPATQEILSIDMILMLWNLIMSEGGSIAEVSENFERIYARELSHSTIRQVVLGYFEPTDLPLPSGYQTIHAPVNPSTDVYESRWIPTGVYYDIVANRDRLIGAIHQRLENGFSFFARYGEPDAVMLDWVRHLPLGNDLQPIIPPVVRPPSPHGQRVRSMATEGQIRPEDFTFNMAPPLYSPRPRHNGIELPHRNEVVPINGHLPPYLPSDNMSPPAFTEGQQPPSYAGTPVAFPTLISGMNAGGNVPSVEPYVSSDEHVDDESTTDNSAVHQFPVDAINSSSTIHMLPRPNIAAPTTSLQHPADIRSTIDSPFNVTSPSPIPVAHPNMTLHEVLLPVNTILPRSPSPLTLPPSMAPITPMNTQNTASLPLPSLQALLNDSPLLIPLDMNDPALRDVLENISPTSSDPNYDHIFIPDYLFDNSDLIPNLRLSVRIPTEIPPKYSEINARIAPALREWFTRREAANQAATSTATADPSLSSSINAWRSGIPPVTATEAGEEEEEGGDHESLPDFNQQNERPAEMNPDPIDIDDMMDTSDGNEDEAPAAAADPQMQGVVHNHWTGLPIPDDEPRLPTGEIDIFDLPDILINYYNQLDARRAAINQALGLPLHETAAENDNADDEEDDNMDVDNDHDHDHEMQ